MKRPASKSFRGFTLIELLVVMTIISVLAALGFGAAMAALNRARKVKAQASAAALDQAVEMFYTDYSYLPINVPTNGTPPVVDTTVVTTGAAFLEILLGKEPSTAGVILVNPKRIRFLNVKEGKGNSDGLVYGAGGAVTGLFDPWGGPFSVIMDFDYDEEITIPPGGSGAGTILHNRRVATWSQGADGASGSAAASKDDVKTY